MDPMRYKISNLLIVVIGCFQMKLPAAELRGILLIKHRCLLHDNLAKKFIRTFWGPDAFNGRLQHGLSISAPLYKRDWG